VRAVVYPQSVLNGHERFGIASPARWTRVSRSEDRTIGVELVALFNSIYDTRLRDRRNPRFVALPLPLTGVLHDSGSSMKHLALIFFGFALYVAPLRAQAAPGVPESHRPPPGMCRIWIDGVPPAHQPAPTDCATAIRKRPLNARVVFGSEAPAGSERNVAPAPRVQPNFVPQSVPQRVPSAASSREEQDRIVQQQRDEKERQRIEAQRQRDEQKQREANHAPPPPPPQAQPPQSKQDRERTAPQQRPRPEKAQRPPQQSHSARRPR
jgi:hypothetical protein